MNWKLLFNPFQKIETNTLLIIGGLLFLIGSFFAFYFGFTFDGVLDLHTVGEISLLNAFKQNAINIVILWLLLLGLGLFINAKTRWNDVLVSVLIFRIPFYLMILLSSIPFIKNTLNEFANSLKIGKEFQFEIENILIISGYSMVSLALLVYAIILLFNGFKTATNAKGWRHYLSFALVLIVSEVITKFII